METNLAIEIFIALFACFHLNFGVFKHSSFDRAHDFGFTPFDFLELLLNFLTVIDEKNRVNTFLPYEQVKLYEEAKLVLLFLEDLFELLLKWGKYQIAY